VRRYKNPYADRQDWMEIYGPTSSKEDNIHNTFRSINLVNAIRM